jgi:transposase
MERRVAFRILWIMRPHGSPQELERRRRRAIALLQRKMSLSAVAAKVGASVSSVHRWQIALRKKGAQGLDAVPAPGRPRKLTDRQHRRLETILVKGPLALGYDTDLWTLPRIASVIAKTFGVHYHPSHVFKILVGMGWSCQKPEKRALQRDEAAIAAWKKHEWPRIKKNARTWRPARVSGRKRVPTDSDRAPHMGAAR